MDELISRQAAIDAIHEDADWLAAQGSDWQVERMERDKSILKSLPAVQPNHDAEPGKMVDDTVSRQAAMERLMAQNVIMDGSEYHNGFNAGVNRAQEVIKNLPPVQPTIIRCKDCEHWKLQIGNVKGDGLGSCDFHNVNFVTGEGFCYWADKRGDSE